MNKIIRLSIYRAHTQKKKTNYSIRCIGRIIAWKRGKECGRYISLLTLYDDESIRSRGKYSDDEDGIRKAQEQLDDMADSHNFRYAGRNDEIPTYDHYTGFNGGYFPV